MKIIKKVVYELIEKELHFSPGKIQKFWKIIDHPDSEMIGNVEDSRIPNGLPSKHNLPVGTQEIHILQIPD